VRSQIRFRSQYAFLTTRITPEIKRAIAILEQNVAATKSGKGAFGLEGEGGKTMIDAPVVR
jgi:citrate lyase beta subunit